MAEKIIARGEQTIANVNDGKTKEAIGIKLVTIMYAVNTSSTVAPTDGWSTNFPGVTAGRYLWTRTTTDYTDGTSSTAYSVAYSGENGTAGNGIKETSVGYALGDSATVPPATGWGPAVPSNPNNKYLWTDTQTTYDNGNVTHAYAVTKSGNGILSITDHYALSASATTTPTDWSENVPALKQGWYLWTKTTTTFDDKSTSDKYSVVYIGKDGQTGNGIKGTTIDYALATQGTTAPTAGWQTSIPTVTKGAYLWTRVTTTYTSTDKKDYTYTVAYQGGDGVGIASIVYTYAISDTASSKPADSSFSSVMPTDIKGKYLWTLVTTTFTDGKSTKNYTVSYSGIDGNNADETNVINSPTPPKNPMEGTWWNDTSQTPPVLKYYQSSSWVIYQLSAINISAGTITGDKIASNTVTTTNLKAGSVTADKIDVTNLTAKMFSTDSISVKTTLDMNAGTITGTSTNSGSFPTQLGLPGLDFGAVFADNLKRPITYTYTGTYTMDSSGYNIAISAKTGNTPSSMTTGYIDLGNGGGGSREGVFLTTFDQNVTVNSGIISISSKNVKGISMRYGDEEVYGGSSVMLTSFGITMTQGNASVAISPGGLYVSERIKSNHLYVGNPNYSSSRPDTPSTVLYGLTTSEYLEVSSGDLVIKSKGGLLMQGSGNTKNLRTAHRQWSAWFGQKWDLFREGDVVYATVMASATQDIPAHTTSDEALPSGYIPKWQDATVLISDLIGRDVGIIFRTGTGKMVNIGSASAPWTSRWSAVWFTGDPFPTGDILN